VTLQERWDSRVPPWLEALLIGIASRAFATAVLVTATLVPIPPPNGPVWENPFMMWDAAWYSWVARMGYHDYAVAHTAFGPGYYDFAFFPAWPIVLRIAVTLTGQAVGVIGPILAAAIFIAATVPIYRVLERVGGRGYARFGTLLFAFSPAAYIYSEAYSEPLFLLFAGLFFLSPGYVRPAIFGALAMFSRLSGAALAVASLPDLLKAETRRRGLATLAWTVGAFAIWWLWIANLTHNIAGYMLGSPSWYANDSPTGTRTGIVSILNAPQWMVWITIILLVALAIGTAALFRKGEPRLAMFSLAAIASAFLVTSNTMPRLAAVAFPAFAAFGALLPSDRWRWLLVGLSAAAEAILGAMAVARVIVP